MYSARMLNRSFWWDFRQIRQKTIRIGLQPGTIEQRQPASASGAIMASAQLANVVEHIHQIAGASGDAEHSDSQLLQSFLANQDESAFRLLVQRHGRMVLSVCRNVLRQTQDAEDAFQATFLVLAKSAGSIREGTALGSWLYGVAYRISLKARSQMSKRHQYEKRAPRREPERPDLDLALRELQTVLTE